MQTQERDGILVILETLVAAMADSYKYSHYLMQDDDEEAVAYGEFRSGLSAEDTRIVVTGVRYIVEHYLHHRWTHQELDILGTYMSTHSAGGVPYPWPEDLFRKFVDEND